MTYKVFKRMPQGTVFALCDSEFWTADLNDSTIAEFSQQEAEKIVEDYMGIDPSDDEEFWAEKVET